MSEKNKPKNPTVEDMDAEKFRQIVTGNVSSVKKNGRIN